RERDLRYAKPSLSATWRPAEGLELRGSVRRSVGQLDFNDFAASAELASDRTQTGNPELVPDRRTRATLALDLRGQEGAALNLQVFAEQRQDVVDAVILSPGQGGTGNAGSARVWGLSASGALPLDGLAAGLRLSANGLWQDARFTDPATAQRRLLNDFEPQRYKVELRQDLRAQKRAWGLTLDGSLQRTSYFSNQSSRLDFESRWGAFLETSEFTGLKARLAVLNLGGYDVVRENRFFTPDRTGAPAGRQALVFPYDQTVQFSVAGTF
ncbi:MAG: TonB-dependent receptor domain-containing protein, partial [Rubrivivax sp.]